MPAVREDFDSPTMSVSATLVKLIIDHPGSTAAEICRLLGKTVDVKAGVSMYAKKGLVRVERTEHKLRGWANTYTATQELIERTKTNRAFRPKLQWTKARKDEFAERFPEESDESLARSFGITVRAVDGMARRLNIRKRDRPVLKSWSDSEISELAERYPKEDSESLARAFGVTTKSLQQKAARLKLRKAYGFYSYSEELREVIRLNNRLKRKIHERYKKTP